jgi:hypothetical protein
MFIDEAQLLSTMESVSGRGASSSSPKRIGVAGGLAAEASSSVFFGSGLLLGRSGRERLQQNLGSDAAAAGAGGMRAIFKGLVEGLVFPFLYSRMCVMMTMRRDETTCGMGWGLSEGVVVVAVVVTAAVVVVVVVVVVLAVVEVAATAVVAMAAVDVSWCW